MDSTEGSRLAFGSPPLTPPPSPPAATTARVDAPLAMRLFGIMLASLLSLAVNGYQIGKSNHTVYLLAAFRKEGLLTNDWFTNKTLQYHGLFSHLTQFTIEKGIFDPVFKVGHILTVLAFSWSCWRVVRALGGSVQAYLLSIVLLYLSAGGTGLGGFQFLQDGAFLPSNISNVAMLAGIAMLLESRVWLAGLFLGLAGLFHVNHAVFAGPIFLAGAIALPDVRKKILPVILSGLLVGILSGINIIPAILHLQGAEAGEKLSLEQFVQIYARLRHPHHYYPPAWNPLLYLASLWTLIPAGLALAYGKHLLPATPRRVIYAVSGLLIFATLVALTFAGFMFISERLIQMAVFRFSIYYIYFGCALTAWGLLDSKLVDKKLATAIGWAIPAITLLGLGAAYTGFAGDLAQGFVHEHYAPLLLIAAIFLTVAIAIWTRFKPTLTNTWWIATVAVIWVGTVAWGRCLGLNYIPEDPIEYTRLALWARDHTPRDAMFLVPPQEQTWRVAALRSIVINFKAIPQTATEMPEWKRRMEDVTGVQDLSTLAGTFNTTLERLKNVYNNRPITELVATARKYQCRYIVTAVDLPAYPGLERIGPPDGTGPYRLYDLGPSMIPPPPFNAAK